MRCAYCTCDTVRLHYGVPVCDPHVWRIRGAYIMLYVITAPLRWWIHYRH